MRYTSEGEGVPCSMGFECYNQFLRCNVCRYGLHYNEIMISALQEIKGLTILRCNFQEEVQFPCKISGPLFTWFSCFDISMACIIMYCQD